MYKVLNNNPLNIVALCIKSFMQILALRVKFLFKNKQEKRILFFFSDLMLAHNSDKELLPKLFTPFLDYINSKKNIKYFSIVEPSYKKKIEHSNLRFDFHLMLFSLTKKIASFFYFSDVDKVNSFAGRICGFFFLENLKFNIIITTQYTGIDYLKVIYPNTPIIANGLT